MIVPNRPSWLGTMTTPRGSTIVKTWPRLSLVALVSTLVTWLHETHGLFHTNSTITPFTLIGLALGIFLGFRNTTSYDRYWEGRKLWGGIVNTSRTMCRQIDTLILDPQLSSQGELSLGTALGLPEREVLVRRIIAYVHAVRMHLREQFDHSDVQANLPSDEFARLAHEGNRPLAILHWQAQHFGRIYARGLIDPQRLTLLDRSLTEFTDLQGGCERIRATPIPFSYNILLHRIVFVYCFALPFGLVDIPGLHVYTPVVTLLVSYAFFGLDAVGDEIENPFGLDPNDLPLSALTRTIEINLLARLGIEPLPPPLLPENEVLL